MLVDLLFRVAATHGNRNEGLRGVSRCRQPMHALAAVDVRAKPGTRRGETFSAGMTRQTKPEGQRRDSSSMIVGASSPLSSSSGWSIKKNRGDATDGLARCLG